MELIEIMNHRRSIRKYTAEAISDEDIELILKAAMTSASGRGKRSWSFILVQDGETLKKLSVSRSGGASVILENAQRAIVVVGDTELSDTWIEDCSIALTNMQLMTDSLGLGSCWIQIRGRNHSDNVTSDAYVKELLNIPDRYNVEAVLSIGVPYSHPAERDIDRLYEELSSEKIHENRWK